MNKYEKLVGKSYGTPAPGNRVNVNTALAFSQRDLKMQKVKDYAFQQNGVNWDHFGYVKVVQYDNGKLEILDGQHRLQLVKDLLPEVREVPAHIIHGTPEYAAQTFVDLNDIGITPLSAEEKFWALVVAKESKALLLQNVLEKTRYSIGKVNAKEDHRPLRFPNAKKAIGFGASAFIRSCAICDEVWPKGRISDQLISGMSRLLSIPEYEDVGNPNRKIGRDFVQWLHFVNKAIPSNVQTALEFGKLQNKGPWYNATAWGLCSAFMKRQRYEGKPSINIKTMKDIWDKPIREMEDDTHSLILGV